MEPRGHNGRPGEVAAQLKGHLWLPSALGARFKILSPTCRPCLLLQSHILAPFLVTFLQIIVDRHHVRFHVSRLLPKQFF